MKNIPYIIISLLFGYVVFLHQCQKPPEIQPQPDSIIIDSIVRDTVTIRDTVYVPKWNTRTIVEIDSFIDTAFVLQDYNTKFAYSDTIQDDSTAFLAVFDTIYQNRIKSRKIAFSTYPEIIYRTRLEIPDKKLYLLYGGSVSGWTNKFGFEFGAGLQFKNSNIGLISYDPLNKNIRFSYFIRRL